MAATVSLLAAMLTDDRRIRTALMAPFSTSLVLVPQLVCLGELSFFFFSSRRRHTRLQGDRSSDVCSSDLQLTRPRVTRDFATWWRRCVLGDPGGSHRHGVSKRLMPIQPVHEYGIVRRDRVDPFVAWQRLAGPYRVVPVPARYGDRKSTRLNSSHLVISYAVLCLKKKTRLNSSHLVISYAVFCLKKNTSAVASFRSQPCP